MYVKDVEDRKRTYTHILLITFLIFYRFSIHKKFWEAETLIKVKLFISKASNICSKSMDFFFFAQLVKIPNKFTQFERKQRKFTARLNLKIFIGCMHIMQ